MYLRQATTLACKRHVQAMYMLHVQLMYIVYMKSSALHKSWIPAGNILSKKDLYIEISNQLWVGIF